MRILKFGGTSVKGATVLMSCVLQIAGNIGPMFVIVSAPAGMTNQLKAIYAAHQAGGDFETLWKERVYDRFFQMMEELEFTEAARDPILRKLGFSFEAFKMSGSEPVLLAIGEMVNSMIVAQLLQATHLEARDFLVIDPDTGQVIKFVTYGKILAGTELNGRYVMGGFYGATPNGEVRTLTRGGSDETAALVAAALNLRCEIWTDVSGIMNGDPTVIDADRLRILAGISYDQCLDMAMGGAKVIHPNAVQVCREAGVELVIKNTMARDAPGTVVSLVGVPNGPITGIAGVDHVSLIRTQIFHYEVGVGERMLRIFGEAGVPIDLAPTVWSSMGVTLTRDQADADKLEALRQDISRQLARPVVADYAAYGLIAIVGDGVHGAGVMQKMYGALEAVGIDEVPIVSTLPGSASLVIGVPTDHYKHAFRTLHTAFFHGS